MIAGFELYVIASDYVTADILIWKRYRCPTPGIVEAMLDANPQMSLVHKTTPFLPVGMYVRVPIDLDLLSGTPPASLIPATATWGPGVR